MKQYFSFFISFVGLVVTKFCFVHFHPHLLKSHGVSVDVSCQYCLKTYLGRRPNGKGQKYSLHSTKYNICF